jgi:prolycopene isomerase
MITSLPLTIAERGRRARYDAVVVGTGVGGSAASALLASQGKRVLVLEKNDRVGGILAGYHREGFTIDQGSHLLPQGARGPIGDLLRDLRLKRPRLLIHPIPVRSRGMFEITAPPRRSGLLGTWLEAARKLRIDGRERLRIARFLWETRLQEPDLGRLDEITLEEYLFQFTRHPGTYFLISFLSNIFFVLPPWRVAAGEALRGIRDVLRSYSLSYVEGGMSNLPRALLGFVPAAGGDIVLGERVQRIESCARGLRVATSSGSDYEADTVIADLDGKDLIDLVGESHLPSDWVGRVRALESSGNAHQLKLGLSTKLLTEGCLIGGFSRSGLTTKHLSVDLMHRSVEAIERGDLSDPLAIYAPVPSNFDARLAPPGAQLVVASVFGSTGVLKGKADAEWSTTVVDLLDQAVPGLKKALLFVEFEPIRRIGDWMGKSNRAAISNGQVPGQVGAQRLSVRTPISGLFLAGDGAGGYGIGTELAVRSAREAVAAADLVLR